MVRVNRFWNLRVKLVALLGCLLAGTLTAQAWLHDASERKLLNAVEEVAGEIATEAVEMMMRATAAIPTQPTRVSITFRANTPAPGNRTLIPDEQTFRELRKLQQAMVFGAGSGTPGQLDEALLKSPLNDLVRAMISRNFPDVDVQEALAFADQKQKQKQKRSEDRSAELANAESASAGLPFALSLQRQKNGQDPSLEMMQEEDFVVGSVIEADQEGPATPQESKTRLGSPQKAAPLLVLRSSVPGRYGRARSAEKIVAQQPDQSNDKEIPFEVEDALTSGIDLQPHLDRLQHLVREARQRDLLATVGVFLLGVVLAWLLGTRLVRPVTEVVDGMRVVASGDLAMRLPEREDPEFGLVSRQFNDMVERLEDARRIERGLEHRERVQTMGDLAAGVAHDIRNPLSAISLHVGRIRREFEPDNPEAREKFLNYTGDVKEEIERLNRLVTNFLQLAQPASHEAEPVAPGELLEEVRRLLEKEAAAHQVTLQVEVQDDLCEARWNRIEAKSAFLNVAMNAIQAMAGVGGTLRMSARSDQQWAVISFVDDGPGIAEQDQEKVMLPYVTMRPGGTGLGLAIARRVAERHGGRLELGSEVGVGTEVRFLMPSDDGEAS
ncbi:MAG: ATP-binding protein [Planctomycetota bacterium]|nr:ATP-binding protein [Planctomycetota bacterium]